MENKEKNPSDAGSEKMSVPGEPNTQNIDNGQDVAASHSNEEEFCMQNLENAPTGDSKDIKNEMKQEILPSPLQWPDELVSDKTSAKLSMCDASSKEEEVSDKKGAHLDMNGILGKMLLAKFKEIENSINDLLKIIDVLDMLIRK